MSTQYNGIPGIEIDAGFPSPKAISSVSNTSPIVVTTTTAHGLTTGDVIRILGTGIQALNDIGFWRSVVLSTTTVELHDITTGAASTALGVGGAVGTLQSYAWGTTYQIPSDGPLNPRTAASVNVALEALGNRTAFLLYKAALPDVRYRLIDIAGNVESDTNEDDSVFWTWANTAYVDGSGATQLIGTMVCQSADVLDIDASFVATVAGGDSARFRLQVSDTGGPFTPGGGRFFLPAGTTRGLVTIRSTYTVVGAGTRTVKMQAKSSAGNNVQAVGAGAIRINHYRANP